MWSEIHRVDESTVAYEGVPVVYVVYHHICDAWRRDCVEQFYRGELYAYTSVR